MGQQHSQGNIVEESHETLKPDHSQREPISFDRICESFCAECRPLSWLGKASPPVTEVLGRPDPFGRYSLGRRSKPHFSASCEMCQLIRRRGPRNAKLEWIDVSLQRFRDVPFHHVRAKKEDPYDVIEVALKVHGREGHWVLNFAAGSPLQQGPITLQCIGRGFTDYARAKTWIDHCERHHSICNNVSRQPVPGFKVMDCVTKTVLDLLDEHCQYTALSYVWGCKPVSNGEFPRVIADSMEVTLNLGMWYLWVDRYVCQILDCSQRIQLTCASVLIKTTLKANTNRSERWIVFILKLE